VSFGIQKLNKTLDWDRLTPVLEATRAGIEQPTSLFSVVEVMVLSLSLALSSNY
jgi:hypothetical protein